MHSRRLIHVVGCHAEGEVGDVITGGVAPPPGATPAQRARFIADDDQLRRFVLNEPRGGVFRHVNLLVPPIDPAADAAFIIMEPEDTPPMSGSNTICVATVVLETGLVPMTEPVTALTLEAPAGLVQVRAQCRDGRVERVTLTNVASFVDRLDAPLEVAGLGTLTVATAYGGDAFVIVPASDVGLALTPDAAADIVALGSRIRTAAHEQMPLAFPGEDAACQISFCQFTDPLRRDGDTLRGRNASVIRPGKIDRSPTGTGCSARMALLHARGEMAVGERYVAESIIGSTFECRLLAANVDGSRQTVTPEVSGRGFITGTSQLMLDPDDPWPSGYRVADTWPSR